MFTPKEIEAIAGSIMADMRLGIPPPGPLPWQVFEAIQASIIAQIGVPQQPVGS